MKKNRELGLDIVRFLAVILVPLLHAYAYIPVLDYDLLSLKWFIFVALHYFSLICVPLFLMLSGALMRKKAVSKRYYAGILRIVVPYAIISVATVVIWAVFRDDYNGVVLAIKSVLNFTAIDYAWYVEMYIGLYLLIPFFNTLFNSLDKRGNGILLLTFIGLTTLPGFLKGISLELDILPNWWTVFYPVTYYFLGAYLAEYKPRIKKLSALMGFVLSIALPTAFNAFYTMRDNAYAWYVMNSSDCLSTLAIATFVWLLLADIKKIPKSISFVITEVSLLSLEIYLYSFTADGFIYPFSDEICKITSKLHIPLLFVMPVLVILSSFIVAKITSLISAPMSKLMIKAVSHEKHE